ncbi:MAG: hypothetical protein MJH09_09265 [Cetobacterium sp.]|nr:hypothetical protein [Cetobacterium sp.]
MFEKELTLAKRNIYVSKAISRLPGKTGGFREILLSVERKYGDAPEKSSLRETHQRKIVDLKTLIAASIIKESKLIKRGA